MGMGSMLESINEDGANSFTEEASMLMSGFQDLQLQSQ